MQPIEINKHQFFKIELLEVPLRGTKEDFPDPEIKPLRQLRT